MGIDESAKEEELGARASSLSYGREGKGRRFTVDRKSSGIYATVALIDIVVYVFVGLLGDGGPDSFRGWVTFILIGLATAVIASAIVGTVLVKVRSGGKS
ncbi:hypothetical protein CAPI_00505 [Corynebacterium capitovis DSM 44611]|nr:hypothetical protein CAPI_00505 [Corynebacterium capitovis DSM 44611]